MKKNTQAKILLLEDDADLRELLVSYYEPRGYEIICHADPTLPLREIEGSEQAETLYDLVITDLKMPKMDGLEFIRRMKALAPKVPIILMTAHGGVDIALEAISEGAYDFVVKPLHFPQLNVSIERALYLRKVENDNQILRSAVKQGKSFAGAIGKSVAMTAVFDLAKRVANSTATVLITGESGSGKEVVARAIHQLGNRKDGPFVAVNCSAIPENLLEAEFFGYAKGAFTGAIEKKTGLFEEAEGGILFLDEIGDLSFSLQAKLLRVIQERKIKRIGENVYRPINIRILTATHKDLNLEVNEKRFREDLFFRLNVIPIKIPPLRARPEDILPLAEHFLHRFRIENGTDSRSFSKAALEQLLASPWRGNVRELENAIERAVVLADGPEIDIKDLPPMGGTLEPTTPTQVATFATVHDTPTHLSPQADLLNGLAQSEKLPPLEEFILDYVELVMTHSNGVKEQAARTLEVDRKTLYRRLDELEKSGRLTKFTALRSPTPLRREPLRAVSTTNTGAPTTSIGAF